MFCPTSIERCILNFFAFIFSGVVSLFLSLRVDRMYDQHLAWNEKFAENDTVEYQQLEYEAGKAVSKIILNP